jgi:uncharacterized membrane protein HdeD (DUF308 family)
MLNFIALAGIVAIIWLASKRTRWRFVIGIAIGVLLILFRETTPYPGDTACYGIVMIVLGAFWFIFSGIMTSNRKP